MFGLWLIAFVSGVAFAHLFGSGVSLNNEMNEIGEKIRRIRNKNGDTQEKLAEKLAKVLKELFDE